ncbi:MAG: sporulation integral membrane protein YtvI [Ruminococcaceae bacterium]|nr:sporulation integral membrane protein YtvI [Oscillospiraceae bacterium]
MGKVIEKRKSFVITFIYLTIFVGLYYFLIKYAMGYIFPFVFAAILSIFLQPVVRWFTKKLHLKTHGFISTVLVLLLVVSVVGLIVGAGYVLFVELKDFFTYLSNSISSVDDIIIMVENTAMNFIGKLPKGIGNAVGGYVTDFFDNLGNKGSSLDLSALSAPLSGAWSVVKGIPSFILSLVVTIISCVFMTAEYDKVRDMILEMCSEETGEKLINAKRTVTKGIGKLIKAYATLMIITFTEVFLGLNLMKLIGIYDGGYIAIIAFVTCIVDIIPVLGTGTILIPWAVYNIITGNFAFGIALLLLYAVITVIRQVIEPKLVANQVGLPSIVTIMAMFLGGRVLGALGIIILPLTVIVLKLMYDEGIIGRKRIPVKVAKKKNN